MRNAVLIGLVSALSGLGAGCGGMRSVVVQTRLVAGEREAAGSELLLPSSPPPSTPGRIAVVWPSECAGETSAAQRGDATPGDTLASIDCAIEVAAFERVLVAQGFDLVHWDSLRRHALAHDAAVETSAQQLGVTLLLRVNSLERGSFVPATDARWERAYFWQGRRGGGPATLPDPLADQLDAMASDFEAELVRGGRLAVTLDVTAVHVPTGQISWFYRWTHHDAAGTQDVSGMVFAECSALRCVRQSDRRGDSGAMDVGEGSRSGSVRAISVQQDDASAQRVIHTRLMFEALVDLAQRMRQLRDGGAGAASGTILPPPASGAGSR